MTEKTITTKATIAGKTCTTCEWFEIETHSVGRYDHELTIECGVKQVVWYSDLTPRTGTKYEAGLSYCPEWGGKKTENDRTPLPYYCLYCATPMQRTTPPDPKYTSAWKCKCGYGVGFSGAPEDSEISHGVGYPAVPEKTDKEDRKCPPYFCHYCGLGMKRVPLVAPNYTSSWSCVPPGCGEGKLSFFDVPEKSDEVVEAPTCAKCGKPKILNHYLNETSEWICLDLDCE